MHAIKVADQVALSSNLDYPGGLNRITWVLNSREHYPAMFIGRLEYGRVREAECY